MTSGTTFVRCRKRRAATRRSQSSTNTWTAADDKIFARLGAKLLKNPPNRDGNPAIAEKVIVQVKIVTNAPLGDCELRVLEQPVFRTR